MSESSVVISKDRNLWETLGCPVYVVGPMVDQSELPFRLLCRRYGAQLCYSPMLHAGIFTKDPKYRKENLVPCTQDRPLIVQFCANDPKTFLEAARMAAPFCDAIDLNLGCPQTIAKRGHYGVFLADEWSLLEEMISMVTKELNIPVTCKIRMFTELDKTIEYAKMLENAGCKLLTVHARTKDQKGVLTGLANWQVIKAIKKNVNIPVFANGNVQCLSDAFNCLEETGVDGVMSAEGVLYNPALFSGIHPDSSIIAQEYLNLVDQYPCAVSIVRGHLFKMYHVLLTIEENFDLRDMLAKANTYENFRKFVLKMKERYPCDSYPPWTMSTFPILPNLCQPHYRTPPSATKPNENDDSKKRKSCLDTDQELSTRTKKKLSSGKLKPEGLLKNPGRRLPLCILCPNPKGTKCKYDLCKACCKLKTIAEVLDCAGHRFLFNSKPPKKNETLEKPEPLTFDAKIQEQA